MYSSSVWLAFQSWTLFLLRSPVMIENSWPSFSKASSATSPGVRAARDSRHGRHVDDGAAVLRGKDAHKVVEHAQETDDVDVHHLLVVLERGVLELAEVVQAGDVAHEAEVEAFGGECYGESA